METVLTTILICMAIIIAYMMGGRIEEAKAERKENGEEDNANSNHFHIDFSFGVNVDIPQRKRKETASPKEDDKKHWYTIPGAAELIEIKDKEEKKNNGTDGLQNR